MSLTVSPFPALERPSAARPARAFLFALGIALAGGVVLAAWSAADPVAPGPAGVMLPRGPLLDRLLDEVQASSAQRVRAHQIFESADNPLRQVRSAGTAAGVPAPRRFAPSAAEAAAVGAVTDRPDLDPRGATQALLAVGMVLDVRQRQVIAARLAGGPHPFAGLRPTPAAPAAF